jgi:hypothetical protein
MLPQRGADEIGLATVSVACTWQFAKFENRKHIHNAGHRSGKKAQKTATKNQSHLPTSTSTEEVLVRLYPYSPNIHVPHPGALPDCINGATLAGLRMVRTHNPSNLLISEADGDASV